MFVDIGLEKNAFLHFWDAIPAALDSGVEEIERPERGNRKNAEKAPDRQGYSERLSRRLGSDRAGHERPDRHQRPARFHQPQLRRPLSRAHALQRTQRHFAQDRSPERARAPAQNSPRARHPGRHRRHHPHRRRRAARPLFRARSFASSSSNGRKIEEQIENLPAPARVFEEPDLVERTVRDFLTDEIDEVVCDDQGGGRAHGRYGRANFAPREEPGETLRRRRADLRDLRRAETNRRCLPSPGLAEMRRLHRDRRDRSARRGRREHRPQQRRPRRRENHPANQPRSGRRNRAPASSAQHRRPDHRRFHRHEEPQGPADGLQPDARAVEARQSQDARPAALVVRLDGDDAAARAGKPERFDLRKLSRIAKAAAWSRRP